MFKQLDLFAAFEEPKAQPAKDILKEPVAAPHTTELPAIAKESLPVIEDVLTVESNFLPVEAITETVTIEVEEPGVSYTTIKKKVKEVKPKPGKRGRKSLKEMGEEVEMISIPADEILFKRQYYSIGEVSTMFNLNTSLLRYWETEFDILKPRKNRKGDRHFRPEDIKNLYLIHHLLRQRKYTIEGAKEYLKKNKNKAQQSFELIQRLEKLKSFLFELKAGL
ncbi:MAG: MerR family transcriptional regulator [Agriterribacter sp.]